MSGNDKTFPVAMTLCFYCLKPSTLVVKRLAVGAEGEREFMNNFQDHVIDMEPCPECAEHMKQGIIFITYDEAKSGKEWWKGDMPNPYRSGGWFVVKDEGAKKIMVPELFAWAQKSRYVFIPEDAARLVGLYGKEAMQKARSERNKRNRHQKKGSVK